MNYSKIIKELRLKLLMSQNDFAKMLGVSFATVNRWENNITTPTYKFQRKLARLFKKYSIKEETYE